MTSAWQREPRLAHVHPRENLALMEETLGEVLRRTAARFPLRRALAWVEGDKLVSLTYTEFSAEAERVAYWLLDHAKPGDRIAPWSRNTVEWALLEFGCALAGMVVASWNPAWTDFECTHAHQLTEPALVLAGRDVRGESLHERACAIAGASRVASLDELRQLARDATPCALAAPSPHDLFLIQFTSGTTGRAKGASLSHFSVVNSAWIRLASLNADETDVFLNPSPLNHMGGAVTMLPGAVLCGGCYVVVNRFEAGQYLQLIRDTGATRIGGVPTMLLALLEHADWRPGQIKVRSVGAGGAQVPESLIERLQREFDAPVLVTYAQSESPIISSTVAPDPPRLLAETVGRCSPNVEIKIVDAQSGATAPIGVVGEICVRSPMVMQGYFRQPEATAVAIDADGFLHTGDLGTLDIDGYLRIGGRLRDVIIRGGENIYPPEVENALLTHPEVVQVCVVGVADERWGQVVAAALQLRGTERPSVEELEDHAGVRLAHFKVPRRWLFLDAFPLTANGKISKLQVEKLFTESFEPGGRHD